MTTTLQPLLQNQRDTNLDILRGIAMAGVLFVFCAGDIGIAETYTNSLMDDAIKWFKWIMVEERMYSMLILVFGIGFSVQFQKAKQKGESLVPVFLRRLVGLLLIGFIHAVFISSRDILFFYGIAGFALLPARNFSNRQLLIYILVALLIWLNLPALLHAFGIPPVRLGSWVPPNDYASYLEFNWQFFKGYHQFYGIYFDMLLSFLLGFYIGKSNLLRKIESNRKLLFKILVISFILTAGLAVFQYGWLENGGYEIITKNIKANALKKLVGMSLRLVWKIAELSFVLFYASSLIAVNSSKVGQRLFKPLAAFGQMALSNYLIQSVLLVPYALWFDKYNNMPPFKGTILFIVVFVFQLAFSYWWLKNFRFGPFEWLLRSFTYWKWQPMKKKEFKQHN
ncbi:MAG TPA: DUF418 domain-containing protein [Chitinophagaceae bacterium]|nr:DUF418 domain-containing protein [Chitinophagaceae bacterium]